MVLRLFRRARLLTAGVSIGMLLSLFCANAFAQSRQDEQLNNATVVLEELREIPENAIPPALLDRAYAIAVIPDMVKIGIAVAGRHGSGVLTVREADGWSAPVFIKLSGGSIGWQAGLQTSDLVLVFTNERGVRNITRGKLTLGADASIAAGPIGRQASAATDASFKAEVYSYSRARGLFAGVAVEGAALRIDDKANAAFYATPAITADAILAGDIGGLPDSAVRFGRTLPPTAGTARNADAAPATEPEAAPTMDETAPAKTFAMGEQPAEDRD